MLAIFWFLIFAGCCFEHGTTASVAVKVNTGTTESFRLTQTIRRIEALRKIDLAHVTAEVEVKQICKILPKKESQASVNNNYTEVPSPHAYRMIVTNYQRHTPKSRDKNTKREGPLLARFLINADGSIDCYDFAVGTTREGRSILKSIGQVIALQRRKQGQLSSSFQEGNDDNSHYTASFRHDPHFAESLDGVQLMRKISETRVYSKKRQHQTKLPDNNNPKKKIVIAAESSRKRRAHVIIDPKNGSLHRAHSTEKITIHNIKLNAGDNGDIHLVSDMTLEKASSSSPIFASESLSPLPSSTKVAAQLFPTSLDSVTGEALSYGDEEYCHDREEDRESLTNTKAAKRTAAAAAAASTAIMLESAASAAQKKERAPAVGGETYQDPHKSRHHRHHTHPQHHHSSVNSSSSSSSSSSSVHKEARGDMLTREQQYFIEYASKSRILQLRNGREKHPRHHSHLSKGRQGSGIHGEPSTFQIFVADVEEYIEWSLTVWKATHGLWKSTDLFHRELKMAIAGVVEQAACNAFCDTYKTLQNELPVRFVDSVHILFSVVESMNSAVKRFIYRFNKYMDESMKEALGEYLSDTNTATLHNNIKELLKPFTDFLNGAHTQWEALVLIADPLRKYDYADEIQSGEDSGEGEGSEVSEVGTNGIGHQTHNAAVNMLYAELQKPAEVAVKFAQDLSSALKEVIQVMETLKGQAKAFKDAMLAKIEDGGYAPLEDLLKGLQIFEKKTTYTVGGSEFVKATFTAQASSQFKKTEKESNGENTSSHSHSSRHHHHHSHLDQNKSRTNLYHHHHHGRVNSSSMHTVGDSGIVSEMSLNLFLESPMSSGEAFSLEWNPSLGLIPAPRFTRLKPTFKFFGLEAELTGDISQILASVMDFLSSRALKEIVNTDAIYSLALNQLMTTISNKESGWFSWIIPDACDSAGSIYGAVLEAQKVVQEVTKRYTDVKSLIGYVEKGANACTASICTTIQLKDKTAALMESYVTPSQQLMDMLLAKTSMTLSSVKGVLIILMGSDACTSGPSLLEITANTTTLTSAGAATYMRSGISIDDIKKQLKAASEGIVKIQTVLNAIKAKVTANATQATIDSILTSLEQAASKAMSTSAEENVQNFLKTSVQGLTLADGVATKIKNVMDQTVKIIEDLEKMANSASAFGASFSGKGLKNLLLSGDKKSRFLPVFSSQMKEMTTDLGSFKTNLATLFGDTFDTNIQAVATWSDNAEKLAKKLDSVFMCFSGKPDRFKDKFKAILDSLDVVSAKNVANAIGKAQELFKVATTIGECFATNIKKQFNFDLLAVGKKGLEGNEMFQSAKKGLDLVNKFSSVVPDLIEAAIETWQTFQMLKDVWHSMTILKSQSIGSLIDIEKARHQFDAMLNAYDRVTDSLSSALADGQSSSYDSLLWIKKSIRIARNIVEVIYETFKTAEGNNHNHHGAKGEIKDFAAWRARLLDTSSSLSSVHQAAAIYPLNDYNGDAIYFNSFENRISNSSSMPHPRHSSESHHHHRHYPRHPRKVQQHREQRVGKKEIHADSNTKYEKNQQHQRMEAAQLRRALTYGSPHRYVTECQGGEATVSAKLPLAHVDNLSIFSLGLAFAIHGIELDVSIALLADFYAGVGYGVCPYDDLSDSSSSSSETTEQSTNPALFIEINGTNIHSGRHHNSYQGYSHQQHRHHRQIRQSHRAKKAIHQQQLAINLGYDSNMPSVLAVSKEQSKYVTISPWIDASMRLDASVSVTAFGGLTASIGLSVAVVGVYLPVNLDVHPTKVSACISAAPTLTGGQGHVTAKMLGFEKKWEWAGLQRRLNGVCMCSNEDSFLACNGAGSQNDMPAPFVPNPMERPENIACTTCTQEHGCPLTTNRILMLAGLREVMTMKSAIQTINNKYIKALNFEIINIAVCDMKPNVALISEKTIPNGNVYTVPQSYQGILGFRLRHADNRLVTQYFSVGGNAVSNEYLGDMKSFQEDRIPDILPPSDLPEANQFELPGMLDVAYVAYPTQTKNNFETLLAKPSYLVYQNVQLQNPKKGLYEIIAPDTPEQALETTTHHDEGDGSLHTGRCFECIVHANNGLQWVCPLGGSRSPLGRTDRLKKALSRAAQTCDWAQSDRNKYADNMAYFTAGLAKGRFILCDEKLTNDTILSGTAFYSSDRNVADAHMISYKIDTSDGIECSVSKYLPESSATYYMHLKKLHATFFMDILRTERTMQTIVPNPPSLNGADEEVFNVDRINGKSLIATNDDEEDYVFKSTDQCFYYSHVEGSVQPLSEDLKHISEMPERDRLDFIGLGEKDQTFKLAFRKRLDNVIKSGNYEYQTKKTSAGVMGRNYRSWINLVGPNSGNFGEQYICDETLYIKGSVIKAYVYVMCHFPVKNHGSDDTTAFLEQCYRIKFTEVQYLDPSNENVVPLERYGAKLNGDMGNAYNIEEFEIAQNVNEIGVNRRYMYLASKAQAVRMLKGGKDEYVGVPELRHANEDALPGIII